MIEDIQEEKKETVEEGKKTGNYEVGYKKPPKEYQIKKGEVKNPKGYKEGTPNRSTVARYVLEMIAKPPETILKGLTAMYPFVFKNKSQKWTNEFLMTVRQMQKAIVQGDTKAYEVLMDSAYGKAKGILGFDDETITEIEIKIKTSKDEKEIGSDNSVSENLEGISGQEEPPDNSGGRNGVKQNGESGPVDGDDNASRESSDNDSPENLASPEGDSNA